MTVFNDDADTYRALAHDYGGYIQWVQRATIRATTVGDVFEAMRIAAERGLKLAVRGADHSIYGRAIFR